MILESWHINILRTLDDDSFVVSAEVGWRVFPNLPRRSASASALGHLIQLRKAGLVEIGDDHKPIIWRRTAAGRAALTGEGGER